MAHEIIDVSKRQSAAGTILIREESDDERQARLGREDRDHSLQARFKQVTFFALGGIYLVLLGTSMTVAFSTSGDPALLQWARSLVTLLAGGAVGFMTGKAAK